MLRSRTFLSLKLLKCADPGFQRSVDTQIRNVHPASGSGEIVRYLSLPGCTKIQFVLQITIASTGIGTVDAEFEGRPDQLRCNGLRAPTYFTRSGCKSQLLLCNVSPQAIRSRSVVKDLQKVTIKPYLCDGGANQNTGKRTRHSSPQGLEDQAPKFFFKV